MDRIRKGRPRSRDQVEKKSDKLIRKGERFDQEGLLSRLVEHWDKRAGIHREKETSRNFRGVGDAVAEGEVPKKKQENPAAM